MEKIKERHYYVGGLVLKINKNLYNAKCYLNTSTVSPDNTSNLWVSTMLAT